ncbi:serine/threonine protein kinase [Egbenema bharatensis]|uniref:serine/threonine protein kinase n=1 Tax=Egbenema bharatensis TaxID=3463334 RepID=UPI003A8A0396
MKLYFEKPIGKGTFADIWLGTDEIGRNVAIKILRKEGKDASTVLQHAQALARAKHPNVVALYSIEKLQVPGQGEEQCIVMEYVNGLTLAERLADGFEPREAFNIGKAILSGVQFIHAQGLAHMDLHDENILITKEGDVKIIDIMYMHSLSDVTENVRLNCLNSDVRQLIKILAQILAKTYFGYEAETQFLSNLNSLPTLCNISRNYLDIFTVISEKLEDVVDLFKVNPVGLKLYKFRAECQHDVDLIESALGEDVVSISKSKHRFPDIEVKLVTVLTLDEIRARMREIEDSHVMLQTIAHHLDYTGNREYDLM